MYQKYFNDILATPILSGFAKEQIQQFILERKMKLSSYKKGCVIHMDGELCDTLEIIIEGQVVIERIDIGGNLLTITDFGEGDILGGNIMFSGNPVYLMTVTAVKDCVVLEIPKKTLFDMLTHNKLFLKAYLEFVSDLTTILGNKIRSTIQLPLRQRIIFYLKQEHKVQGRKLIQLKLTKKELAERFGVQRTSLSRELKKMENEGLIKVSRREIEIIDEEI